MSILIGISRWHRHVRLIDDMEREVVLSYSLRREQGFLYGAMLDGVLVALKRWLAEMTFKKTNLQEVIAGG